MTHHEPDVVRFSPRQLSSQGTSSTRRCGSGLDGAFTQMNLGTRRSSYETIPHDLSRFPLYARPSPTGRSTIPREDSSGYWPSPHFGLTAHSYSRRDFKTYPSTSGAHYQDEAAVPFGTWDMFGPGAIGQERGQIYQPQFRNGAYSPQRRGPPKFGGRHTHDFASGHHNVVDVERIRRGLDVRTTVSLCFPRSRRQITDKVCRSCCETFQTRSTK